MYVLHSYVDLLSKESFVPLQPQFEGVYLACTHYLSVNIAVHLFLQTFQSEISYLGLDCLAWRKELSLRKWVKTMVSLKAIVCQKKTTVTSNTFGPDNYSNEISLQGQDKKHNLFCIYPTLQQFNYQFIEIHFAYWGCLASSGRPSFVNITKPYPYDEPSSPSTSPGRWTYLALIQETATQSNNTWTNTKYTDVNSTEAWANSPEFK